LIQAWFKGEHPDTDQKISSNISLHEFNCPKAPLTGLCCGNGIQAGMRENVIAKE
jgi:hypothetical protein